MDHLAIMKKSWNLIEKIMNGNKTIESRWYKTRKDPWNNIGKGDRVYFKNSGEKVRIRARVEKVKQFSELTPEKIIDLLEKYGKDEGIGKDEFEKFYKLFRNKNYSILVFLKNPVKIKPFDIDKKGFGIMTGWICIEDINQIKISK